MNTTEQEMTCPPGYVEVIATAKGFYGVGKMGSRIREGETFFVPGTDIEKVPLKEGEKRLKPMCLGSWFKPVNPADAAKLLPSTKADKLRKKQALLTASRLAKDPAMLIQTMHDLAKLNAPMQIPAGKVFVEDKPPAKPPVKPLAQ